MTRTDEDIERLVAESRARCGLPPRVEDPAVLDRVMAILRDAPTTKTKPPS